MIARWLLLFVFCIAIPAAFAADVKISALPAASSASMTDEFPANQSGTTRKVTGAQIASLSITNIVTGATGTAGPLETWQTLTNNCAGNNTTSLATCMTTNGLTAGIYQFEYDVVYISSTAGTGIAFAVGTPNDQDMYVANFLYPDQGTTAAAGTADNLTAAVAGGIWAHQSTRTNGASLGPNAGVDTINSLIHGKVTGVIRITASSATLYLSAAAEATAAAGITVASGTTLNLRKVS